MERHIRLAPSVVWRGERVADDRNAEDRCAENRRGTTTQLAPTGPRVSVIIPALNEAKNLEHVLTALPRDVFEVVLVDGGSTDGTPEVARRLRPGLRVIRQTRRGKGNALACGFAAASGDIIVMLDADGSADPGEIPRFVETLVGGADFAKGSRFMDGGGSGDITRLRKLGNRVLMVLANRLSRTSYTDLCYGFNAFWAATCLPVLSLDWQSPSPGAARERLWGDGFEIETLINLRVASAGLKVAEVPSYERPRLHGVSNLNAGRDGWRVLRTIVAERQRHRGQIAGPSRAAGAKVHGPAPRVNLALAPPLEERRVAERRQGSPWTADERRSGTDRRRQAVESPDSRAAA